MMSNKTGGNISVYVAALFFHRPTSMMMPPMGIFCTIMLLCDLKYEFPL